MIVEFAPAKINLSLHVVGKRVDGYHLLDSLVAFADIGDEVAAAPGELLSLALGGPFATALAGEPDNLVLRAARALAAASATDEGAKIRLTKNLPVASGIGGGSSDAAATLRALGRLWGGLPPRERLDELAYALGADTIVCLDPRASWMSGTGETVEPAGELPEAGLVLVNPGIAVPTPMVFRARTGPFSKPERFPIPADAPGLARALAATSNDLAGPALRLAPAIGEALAALESLPGALLSRMSGSGATCFGLFADRPAAAAAAKTLKSRAPAGWWIAAGGWHKAPVPAVVGPRRGC
ncbi:MAG: 4-(cytidine 5'-diphospho)-2-C-methyl-D-erythritol kinase [Alphaproteobacteria bacterium]|nr:4-(cytidine 5'-diphospho)-2-C-methyl-D-erythritol kinase [Alphaproteobacteria bacterium]